MRSRVGLLVVGIILVGQVAVWAAEAPIAVSPGDGSKVATIADACPTFSWGEVEGAKSYELVVYRVGEEGEQAEEVLRQSFPGSVESWTPSLDSCLKRGGQYAWSVRSVGGGAASEWSAPRLFEVAAGPSEAEFEEALQIVRQYVGDGSVGSGNEGSFTSAAAPATSSGPSGPQVSAPPMALAPAAGDSDLMVNGSAVVTVATLAGALCSSTEVRFLDLGDGTVLDCNTGKMWLKDASCLGTGSWDDSGTSVFDLVACLNGTGGFCPSIECTDYTGGTYTDWQVPEMEDLCGLWDGSCNGLGCCVASAGLIDSSFESPAVGNAAGDGLWAEEDAFVGSGSGWPRGYRWADLLRPGPWRHDGVRAPSHV